MNISAARRLGAGFVTAAAITGVVSVAPAAASAQTLSVTRPCFVNTEQALAQITVTGTGWTAGDDVQVSSSGGGVDVINDFTVGSDGTFSGSVGTTTVGQGGAAVAKTTLTATDEDDNATASTNAKVANLAFSVTAGTIKASKKVKLSFSGFPAGPIYGHYVHRGRVALTYNFGRSSGACTVHIAHARAYPKGTPKYTSYAVQFDSSRRYSKHNANAVLGSLTFFRY